MQLDYEQDRGSFMDKVMSKERICLFDNIKFFLIATVVVGHIIDFATAESDAYKSIFLFIYSFHMPLFIFLSGLFNKNRNTKKKVISFVFLGFAIKMLLSLAQLLINGKVSFRLLADGGLPWFMFVMGAYYLISYILRGTDKRLVLVMAVLLACFVGYDSSIGDYLYISRTIVFYPFFVLGEMMSSQKITEMNSKKILKVVSAVVLIMWGAVCLFRLEDVYLLRALFSGRNSFAVNIAFEKWGMLYRLGSYVITAVVSFCVICLMPSRKLPLISNFGARTIQVYFWHWPVLLIMEKAGILDYMFSTPMGKVTAMLTGIVITFILSLKLFAFPSDNILNARKKDK